MKPLFTVHAGEFIAGDYIERTFRRVNVWVPTKDKGVDLLVSDAKNKTVVSFQVKFSRDYLATHMPADFQKPLRACSWFSLKRGKIATSVADYWIFVLLGFARRSTDFIVIKPLELLKRADAIFGRSDRIDSYLWVTEKVKCWETRDLRKDDEFSIAQGRFTDPHRDYTEFLNNWEAVEKLNR